MGKKSKKADRAVEEIACQHCAAAVSSRSKIVCVCTQVVFCSSACETQALASGGGHRCPGPPSKAPVDMSARMREMKMEERNGEYMPDFFKTAAERQAYKEELERTVQEPTRKAMAGDPDLSTRARNVAPGVDMFEKYAADVTQELLVRNACAYQAGIHYKQRFHSGGLTVGRKSVAGSSRAADITLLEADRLAYRYLLQAAMGGHGLAMQSLADCFEAGKGVRECMRTSQEWLWRAALIQSAGAIQLLNTKCVMVNEHMVTMQMLENVAQQLPPGQPLSPVGPNLAALVLIFHNEVALMQYKLPPFASSDPRAALQHRTGAVPVLGTDVLRKLHEFILKIERKGHRINPIYGYRGVAKQATALSLRRSGLHRSLDTQRFVVPPAPASDDRPNRFVREANDWLLGAGLSRLRVECPHMPTGSAGPPTCQLCFTAALERLEAITAGAVMLSRSETLAGHGHMAIYAKRDGTVVSETFKNYGRCEAEVALAVLVASTELDSIAHPLFVAQDPNLLWPLIFDHGSVRAALECVAPHVDWNERLGPRRPPPPATPLAGGAAVPGAEFLRCGADACLNVEQDRHSSRAASSADESGSESAGSNGTPGRFSVCSRCCRRRYCSAACQKADWVLHKGECVQIAAPPAAAPPEPAAAPAAAPAVAPAAAPPAAARGRGGRGRGGRGRGGGEPAEPAAAPLATTTWAEEAAEDEEVIITGLVAKPHLNSRIGRVLGPRTEAGRQPVSVKGEKNSLLLKPGNILRLGVNVVRAEPPRKFQCTDHEKELCEHCCVDFSIVAHLCKIRRSKNDEPIPLTAVERVVSAHFAKLKLGDLEKGSGQSAKEPLCTGVPVPHRRALLATALKVDEPSLAVAATVAGIACFGAREQVFARPLVVEHVAKPVNMPTPE